MTPLVYVLPYAIVFWAVFVWAYVPEFGIVRRAGRGAKSAKSPDAGSMRVIMFGMALATLLAFPLASAARLRFAPSLQTAAFWTGTAILVAGSLLRRHCWRMLGSHFTGDVQARADQPVVTAGAYAFLRHPSYTAGTLMNLGIGVALGSWGSALLLTAVSVVVYSYRMAVEERALLAALGEPYRQFMLTRKRMIPYLY